MVLNTPCAPAHRRSAARVILCVSAHPLTLGAQMRQTRPSWPPARRQTGSVNLQAVYLAMHPVESVVRRRERRSTPACPNVI